jgi:hypothetical protein
MVYRIVFGLLLAASLYGCSGGSSSSSGSTAGADSGTATAATTGGTVATEILFTGVPPTGATVGASYSFKPTIVSSSNRAITFAIQGKPSWMVFDTSTGAVSGTPAADDVGLSGDISIVASDASSTGTLGPFTIRVSAEPAPASTQPPVIAGTPAEAVTAGQIYTFQPLATDAAGKALTFAIVNRPIWATFSTSTGLLSGTPTAAQAGTYSSISILVSDGTTSAVLPMFSIVVTPSASDTPVISGKPVTSVVSGQAYNFQPTASDPNSGTLAFSIAGMPSWATFNTVTGELSGTPSSSQTGVYPDIVISVSNGTRSASLAPFSITVTAPTAPTISGTPATSVTAGQSYKFQPTATDPQGLALTFAIANRPTWATFDTATGELSGTPTATEAGSYPSIVISVSNGTLSASLPQFTIIVSQAAAAGPTISGSPTTSVVSGSAYSFTPTTTDPSGGTLTFSIANKPDWAAFNTATGELSGTPTAADVGTYANITISVSDGKTSASLPAFPIAVTQIATGSATLSWVAPTENTDGTPLTNLAGYRIYYGTTATTMTQSVQIADPSTLTYTISNLSPGTWFFSMKSYTTANVESAVSGVASTTIQ